ncbi:unnamed protein product, partial [Ranitomeya imitator]
MYVLINAGVYDLLKCRHRMFMTYNINVAAIRHQMGTGQHCDWISGGRMNCAFNIHYKLLFIHYVIFLNILLDDMGSNIDKLQSDVSDLMTQAGIENTDEIA